MPKLPPLPRGITAVYRDGVLVGFRARLRVAGREHSHRFPADATVRQMQDWRTDTRSDARHGRLKPEKPTTFAEDVTTYLKAVAALTTFKERKRDMALWVDEFGDRPRAAIRPVDIRIVRDRWLTEGPRLEQRWVLEPVTGRKRQTFEPVKAALSASTVNHRLRALENLWTVLDGRQAPNPVRQVPEAEEPDAPPRALPVELVRAILDTMPDSKAKARLAVLAWTGIPPATLARMSAAMVDADGRAVWVPGRKKGKGTTGRRVPLTTDGLAAFRLVAREDAWTGGERGKGNGRRAFRAACRRVEKAWAEAGKTIDLSKTRPYDLRHSIGTLTYATTGDFRATEQLLGVTAKTAARYAKGAIDPRLAAAVAALESGQQVGTAAEAPKTGGNT